MRRAHIPGLLASTTQIASGLAGFLAVILLLDSGGLAQWAERLDVGPLRAIAAPATEHIDSRLKPLGLDAIRPTLIIALSRLGWSDDPAALAAAEEPPASVSPPPALPPPAPQPPSPPTAQSLPAPPPARPPISIAASAPQRQPGHPAAPTTHVTAPASSAPPAAPPLIATAPPFLTPLTPLRPIQPGHPREIALVGDSMMAVGLSAVLLRAAATDHDLRIIKAFRSGTGLARPDVFNWLTEYPAMIGTNRPDVIIVAIGANDAQSYVDSNGQTLAFGTPPWIASYSARVAAFMTMLDAVHAPIIWVGLPPMKSATYDTHTALINRITYSVVSTYPNATWWNPAPYIAAPDGSFRDIGTVESATGHRKIAHLRADDGIHLSDDGASLLTQILLPCLEPLPLPPPPAPGPG